MWVISAQKEKHCFHIDHGDNKAEKYVFENVGQNIIRGWFMNLIFCFDINKWKCIIYFKTLTYGTVDWFT